MRRRWKALVVVGAVVALVVLIFMIPEPGPDLDWVRKLGPIRETLGKTRAEQKLWGTIEVVERRFDLAGDVLPSGAIDAVNANIAARNERNSSIGLPHDWDHDDVGVDYKTNSIVYYDAIELPRWKRWTANIKNRLGLK